MLKLQHWVLPADMQCCYPLCCPADLVREPMSEMLGHLLYFSLLLLMSLATIFICVAETVKDHKLHSRFLLPAAWAVYNAVGPVLFFCAACLKKTKSLEMAMYLLSSVRAASNELINECAAVYAVDRSRLHSPCHPMHHYCSMHLHSVHGIFALWFIDTVCTGSSRAICSAIREVSSQGAIMVINLQPSGDAAAAALLLSLFAAGAHVDGYHCSGGHVVRQQRTVHWLRGPHSAEVSAAAKLRASC
jgi:hypothetical protein